MPSSPERKPGFSSVPQDIKDAISRVIGARVESGRAISGGFSASANFALELADGRTVFAKGSHPGDDSHGTKTLRREIAVYERAEILREISPRFLGAVSDGDEDGWSLGLWDFMETATKIQAPAEVVARLSRWQGASADFLPQAAEEAYMGNFFSAGRKWARLRDEGKVRAQFTGLFTDGDAAARWLDRNLGPLAAGQARVADVRFIEGPLHGDLRLDNVLMAEDGKVFLVDWPNACRGPLVFDLLFLGASYEGLGIARIEDVLSASRAREDAGSIHAMACALGGYFAENAGRAVPEKMPRLRWMQQSMLVALLRYLERAGITESLPGMQNQQG